MSMVLDRNPAPSSLIFTQQQIEVIKNTVAKGASDDELKMFLWQCERTGLDPFSRQIYSMERKSWNKDKRDWDTKRDTLVSIDGFRVVSERSGKYAGQVGPFWCGEDGVWTDVWLKKGPPRAAKVGIIRTDFKEPIYGVALYDEYVQTIKDGNNGEYKPNSMWSKMPANQLAKCAESLAHRKAFPNDLSGLYTPDEMGQANNPQPVQAEVVDAEFKPTEAPVQPTEIPGVQKGANIQDGPKPLAKGQVVRLARCFDGLDASDEVRHHVYGWVLEQDEPITGHDLKMGSAEFQDFLRLVQKFCDFMRANDSKMVNLEHTRVWYDEYLKAAEQWPDA